MKFLSLFLLGVFWAADAAPKKRKPKKPEKSNFVKHRDDDFAVVAYLPEWRFEGIDYDAIAEHVTHLIFFSLEIAENGSIDKVTHANGQPDRFPSATVLERAKAARARTGMKFDKGQKRI